MDFLIQFIFDNLFFAKCWGFSVSMTTVRVLEMVKMFLVGSLLMWETRMVCSEVEGITSSRGDTLLRLAQKRHSHSYSSPVEPVDLEVIPKGGHSNATAHYLAGLEAGNWVIWEYFVAELTVHADWADRLTSRKNCHIFFFKSTLALFINHFLHAILTLFTLFCTWDPSCAVQKSIMAWPETFQNDYFPGLHLSKDCKRILYQKWI